MTVNKAILVGNLGRDPEMRTSQAGNAIANLNIATTERTKDREGNWTDHTEWHRVVCFGRTAETVGTFLTKGRQVYIEGRIQTRKWQDKDGNDKYSTEIVAREVRFLGSRDGGGGSGGGGSYGGGGSGGGGGGGYAGSSGDSSGGSGSPPDDDIPF